MRFGFFFACCLKIANLALALTILYENSCVPRII